MGSRGSRCVTIIAAVALAMSAMAAFAATGPADAGTVTITGHVLNYDGSPQRPDTSSISAWQFDGHPGFPDMGVGWTMPGQTDATGLVEDGSFTISGLVSNPGHDCLIASYDPPPFLFQMLVLWGLDFSTQTDFTVQPSQTTLVLRGWHGTATPEVWVAGPGGAALTGAQLTVGGAGVVAAPASGYNDVVVTYPEGRWAEYTTAVEWMSPGAAVVAAPAGKTAAETVRLDWGAAQKARLAGTATQRSVAPGGIVRLVLSGWPAGETARFVGLDHGNGSVHGYTQTFTSTGASSTSVVTLTVPDDVPPGTGYEIETIRSDDPASNLSLWSVADVCTLQASRTAIHRGQSVTLSGRLDRNAHGARVTVFARHTPAGEPATIAAKGWTAVGSFRSTSYRVGPQLGWVGAKFVARSFKPGRTTWYIARCHGVFTPVVKVAVH